MTQPITASANPVFSSALQRCFQPAQLNSLTLKNRFIKAGTFEGMTPNGQPSSALQAFHSRIAKGGVAMTTLGFCATEPDGRLHEHMLCMVEEVRDELEKLIQHLHEQDVKVAGQMSHGGGFSKNKQLRRRRPLGPSFGINALGASHGMLFCDAMTQADIRAFVQGYGRACLVQRLSV